MFENRIVNIVLIAGLLGSGGCHDGIASDSPAMAGNGNLPGHPAQDAYIAETGPAMPDFEPVSTVSTINAGGLEKTAVDGLAGRKVAVFEDSPSDGFDERGSALDCLIEPSEISEVATSISGVIEEVAVSRGDRVKKGQVVARLRSNVEKANVALARAELKFRERNYKRWEEMHEQNYASHVEKDEAENRREIAKFQLERAEQVLDERVIRSPFDGVVVQQYLSAGELSEDRKIFKLAKIDVLNVEVIALAHLLGKVRKGMPAKVYPEGPVEGPFSASVTVVDPIVDAASGTLGMRLELPNPAYTIPAGVKCRIEFEDIDP